MTETTTAVILAGGRGTRSADPGTAKLAQVIGGQTLLDRHMDLVSGSSIDEVVVVAGHLGDQVDRIAQTHRESTPPLRVIHEEEQRGTVAALALAAENTYGDRFLVILGDIFMSFPVDRFLEAWAASRKDVAVAVHPSTHPDDSDAAIPRHDGTVLVVSKRDRTPELRNWSSAGLFAITRRGLANYAALKDFGSDVLPAAAADGNLFAYVSSHYFKDTGTPTRLDAARRDFESEAFARRGGTELRKGLFLDRDGVINPASPEFYRAEEYRINPGVAERIRRANRLGIPVIVVTNQPGLAKGFMTFDEHERIQGRLDALLGAEGAFVDDYAFCPHHPEAGFEGEVPGLKITCDCRKPAPGMLLRMADWHGIDLECSVMVGDTDRDEGAAEAAGTRFIRVNPEAGVGPCDAIDQAIEVLTC